MVIDVTIGEPRLRDHHYIYQRSLDTALIAVNSYSKTIGTMASLYSSDL
jgi:hypothetical protein